MKPTFLLAASLAATAAAALAAPLDGAFGPIERPAAPEFDDDAAATTELRRRTMQAASGHFRALDAILRGDAPQKEQVTLHAEALAAIAADLDTVFAAETPHAEGALGASPRIWDEPESFERHLDGFRDATADLAAAAAAGRSDGEDLLAARYQCLACHQEMRTR